MLARRRRVSRRDRRQQIIDVAVQLFAQRGFQGTTTRQIADRAGVNEAILFRHFRHKDELYWAVLELKCQGAQGRRELQKRLHAHGSVRRALAAVAEDILQRNSDDPTRSRLFLYAALENHRMSDRLFRTHLARYYDALAAYIRARIREGKFRRVNPLLAARGFLGMVVHYHLVQSLFGGQRYQKFNPREVSETMADLWLEGMMANGRQRG